MMRHVVKGLASLAALVVLALGGLFAFLTVERSRDVELQTPTGSFAVGRAIYDWRDDTTVDVLAPNRGTKREILAWIWYPAVASPSATADDYIPAEMRAAAPPAGFPFSLVYRDKSRIHTHSLRNSVMAPRQSYPVVVMRGGLAAGV